MSAPDDYEQMIVHNVNATIASLGWGKDEFRYPAIPGTGARRFSPRTWDVQDPESILKKRGHLEEFEIQIIRDTLKQVHRSSPEWGARSWLAEVQLNQIHERSDGPGTHRGLPGPEIAELSSVIGIIRYVRAR